ncbi:deoxynucleoside triphosphate triphosphohydrolase SAMHD1-like isoform X1 [Acanthochromis polyacanthus]|uniref:deoxynucleoside triphosphate triphosphohydrolase SAMHD1-like isoform X1 n=1 Tax=Acanthochromis polyacanthus TaxID=80966 RepID=UPI0022340D67|nr:deoxynucleoside triphosphate triphosphohydrolase SAMHD1-like isoform X1 [Acanthochromis polyacanthus]
MRQQLAESSCVRWWLCVPEDKEASAEQLQYSEIFTDHLSYQHRKPTTIPMEKKEIKDGDMKEMQPQNTGDNQQNSDSSKENLKCDHRTAIRNAVNYFLEKKHKVLNDPIHGLMELHPLLIKIMDTPQFQRLRHIKQLGGAYFVYPGASHNRFEHSVGVAHLAGQLARALSSKQPELGINDRDILCVEIAGLCHDLGHGPFSHLYDGIFIPKAYAKACAKEQWKHEDASLLMFDHLVEDNGLKPLMKLYGLDPYGEKENDLKFITEMIQGKPLTEDQVKVLKPLMELYDRNPDGEKENDLKFITEMIHGKSLTEAQDKGLKSLMELYGPIFPKSEEPKENDQAFIKEKIQGKPLTSWPYEGRTEEKSFLYEIVANKLNGIDVDKFDYFARDAYHLGMQSNFDHKRFIKLARVCEVYDEKTKKPKKHICSRDKEVGNLYDMFHTRNCLHRRAYQHKTNKNIQIMISDAFLKADEHIKIDVSETKRFKLSEAKNDPEAYTKLTDQVFERILHPWSSSEDPKEARKILERIVSRNLYMFVGETKPKTRGQEEMREILQQKIDDMKAELTKDENQIPQQKIKDVKDKLAEDLFPGENEAENFEVSIVTLDYGMKKEDPINNTYFYSKDDLKRGFKIPEDQKSKLLPTTFSEKIMRVYCKNPKNITLKQAREAFKKWCKNNGYTEPVDGDRVEDVE